MSVTPSSSPARAGGADDDAPLLRVRDLKMHFKVGSGWVRAVDGVSFDLRRGQTLGVVGESGSGKSSLGFTLLRLLPPNGRIVEGSITLDGVDIVQLGPDQLKAIRWKRMSMIFQNAMSALNPVFRVGDQIAAAIRYHSPVSKKEAMDEVVRLFERVGISRQRLGAYPHELSGGMKQRAMIALALACKPELVIADEPTTALDVVAQEQVLNQIRQLQKELHLALVFISHDVGVIAELCQQIAVMYAGEIVEYGSAAHIFGAPRHPYTMALLRSFPTLRGEIKPLISVPGSPPDLLSPPPGCRFHPRCPFAQQICREEPPPVVPTVEGAWARCHFANEISPTDLEGVTDAGHR